MKKIIIIATISLLLMGGYAQAQEKNLALNKTATASSQWANRASNGAEKAVDGNTKTRWSAFKHSDAKPSGTESWLQVDFGEKTKFSKVVINGDYFDRTAKYSIEVSNDGKKWKTVVKEAVRECNKSKVSTWEAAFKTVKQRYVRLSIHSSLQEGKPCEPTIGEFEVY